MEGKIQNTFRRPNVQTQVTGLGGDTGSRTWGSQGYFQCPSGFLRRFCRPWCRRLSSTGDRLCGSYFSVLVPLNPPCRTILHRTLTSPLRGTLSAEETRRVTTYLAQDARRSPPPPIQHEAPSIPLALHSILLQVRRVLCLSALSVPSYCKAIVSLISF